ncbi:CGNR zinc finger domain-containing protein [Mycobacterium barrassiae]|uniref:CGNR zinc finger domain-containing protein n=1 Tax=Mycobacterium barrassiae TaxID=319709 RepID=UPI002265D81C|nr:CGNR zinc finger domain-containing protein [Mycobacterium barrassiae]MCV7298747.1 CGNR zinc finger domain-containing protein [Mycobacterium barrassiae]
MAAEPQRWPADDESKPAPGPLLRVQALVNTVELPAGPDRLADAADARPWLIDQGLLAPGTALSDADLQQLRDVREALRALLLRNGDGPAPTEAELAPLRAVAAGGAARAEFDADGAVRLAAAGESVSERLVELLLIVRDAQRDGSWARLKVCANDECRWAFYDRSRNHGGTWCEMSTCGNKLKNREFRARRKASR